MEESRLLDQLREALAAHYDVERVLGHGGMGMVVLGRDRALDRPVAIKVISPEIDVTPRHRQRFLQEARIIAKLRHPNIVAVHAVGETNDLLYFVMGYVPGESLRELLTRDRCCTPGRAARILRDLADALAFAHERGVVHRDIKPENVLLDHETGRAMLADFGVAQALAADGGERLTRPGVVVGSPQYMSPEQAAGERDLDGRSDIYALGLVGYEMLTGEPAFSGTNLVAVLTKQLTEPPPPLGPRVPDAPPEVVATIMRALEKDADDRWQDASEMAYALGGEIPAAPARPAEPEQPAPPAAAPFATASHPEQPRSRPFVGPGRPPPRAGRARRFASWLAAISAVLLFAAPLSWITRSRSASSGDVNPAASVLVAPMEVQSPDSALELARRAGARTVVVGQVLHGADSLRVVAGMYDVASGQRVGEAYRSAPPGADPRLIFDALARDILSNTSLQTGQPRETRP
ncbi:MAG: serine/threonine protein kinase [Gemmatimonadota bacterium]|nr:serine/threonine protein kinase [Gemmatimonadota bacterium]